MRTPAGTEARRAGAGVGKWRGGCCLAKTAMPPSPHVGTRQQRPGKGCRCVVRVPKAEAIHLWGLVSEGGVMGKARDEAACFWPLCTPLASWGVGALPEPTQEPLLLLGAGLRSCLNLNFFPPVDPNHAIHLLPPGWGQIRAEPAWQGSPSSGPPKELFPGSSSSPPPPQHGEHGPSALAPLPPHAASRLPW